MTTRIAAIALLLASSVTALAVDAPSGSEDDGGILGFFALLVLLCFVLSIIGTAMGLKGRLVVYYGRFDLNMTCWIIMFLVAAAIGLSVSKWLVATASVLVLFLLILSFRRSYQANGTWMRTAIAVPTKFGALALITVCAFFALGGAAMAVDAVKKRDVKNLVRGATAAAGGGLGYVKLKKNYRTSCAGSAHNHSEYAICSAQWFACRSHRPR